MEKVIRTMMAKYLDLALEDIKPHSNIRDLSEDSIDFIEFIIALEEEFGIEIEDSDIDQLIEVQDVINFIMEKIPDSNKEIVSQS